MLVLEAFFPLLRENGFPFTTCPRRENTLNPRLTGGRKRNYVATGAEQQKEAGNTELKIRRNTIATNPHASHCRSMSAAMIQRAKLRPPPARQIRPDSRGDSDEIAKLRAQLDHQREAFADQLETLRQKQSELHEANQRLLNLFQQLPIASVRLDHHGRILEANLSAVTLLDRKMTSLLGRPMTALIYPDDMKLFLKHLDRCRNVRPDDPVEEKVVTDLRLRNQRRQVVYARLISSCFDCDGQRAAQTVILDLNEYSQEARAVKEAQAFSHKIIQTIHEPLLVLDDHLKVISTNRAFMKDFGKSDSSVKGQFFEAALNLWWSGNDLRAALEGVLKQKLPLRDFSINVDFAPKGWRTLLINAQPFEHGDSAPTLVLMTIKDITQHKLDEDRLQRSEAMLTQAQQIAHVGSWEWEPGTDKLTWSKELFSIFGVDGKEFKATFASYLDYIHPHDRGWVEQIVRRAVSDGRPFDFYHRLIRPDGNIRILHCQGLVQNQNSHGQKMFGVAQDVTEFKEIEAQLRRANEDLELRVEKRTQDLQYSYDEMQAFCYTIAHDLRAPLRAIRGLTEALVEDYCKDIDDQGRDYVKRIVGATAKMDLLIRDLLAYGRLTMAELPISNVEIQPIIQHLLSIYEGEIKEKKAEVSVDPVFPAVRGNTLIVEMVLTNVFSNALKFVEPGAIPKIEISAEETNGDVRICIVDQGIGIAPEHQKKIFQVFQRLHSDEKYPGTGIGLAVVKKGIERIGGSVGLESEPGRGTKFWIQLPKAS